jgi:hypothetical protein
VFLQHSDDFGNDSVVIQLGCVDLASENFSENQSRKQASDLGSHSGSVSGALQIIETRLPSTAVGGELLLWLHKDTTKGVCSHLAFDVRHI